MADIDEDEDKEPFDAALFARRKQQRIADLEESVRYFEQSNKSARERHVVQDFLRNLGTRFASRELISVAPADEPPDVRFRSARFEVKELMDARRRHQEYKRALNAARDAQTFEELWQLTPLTPQDITLGELVNEVTALGLKVKCKYGRETVQRLDLLVYYNKLEVWGLSGSHVSDVRELVQQGWRSVAVTKQHAAVVLAARSDAPRFLTLARGTVKFRRS